MEAGSSTLRRLGARARSACRRQQRRDLDSDAEIQSRVAEHRFGLAVGGDVPVLGAAQSGPGARWTSPRDAAGLTHVGADQIPLERRGCSGATVILAP